MSIRRAASWTHPRQDRSVPRGARITRDIRPPSLLVVLLLEGRGEPGVRRLGLVLVVGEVLEVLLELLRRELVAALSVLQRADVELHVLADHVGSPCLRFGREL